LGQIEDLTIGSNLPPLKPKAGKLAYNISLLPSSDGAFARPNHQAKRDAAFYGKEKDARHAQPLEPGLFFGCIFDLLHLLLGVQAMCPMFKLEKHPH